jgi:hypothetical protein
MSTIHTSNAARLYLRLGLSALTVCSLATMALADDQTMRTTYPQFGGPSNSSDHGTASNAATSQPTEASYKINWSKFGNHASGLLIKAGQAAGYASGNPPAPGSPPDNSSAWNQPAPGSPAGGSSSDNVGTPPAVASGRLPSAMPNPAAQSCDSARQAEHQRVLNNMRRAGYSEDRIKAAQSYMPGDPPGTTYRMVNGIRVRNDGMTPGQALNNITNSGLMNTPINSDPRHYAPGTYGNYRGMGGTKNFGQWLNGDR